MTEKKVLDPCCGAKKFYFDKNAPQVLFGDIRSTIITQYDGRILHVCPEQIMDFTALPFEDCSFPLVIFDPPHLLHVGNGFQGQSYGRLPGQWKEFLAKSFSECYRVLKPEGTLIFKWSECQLKLHDVLDCFCASPLLGNRRPKGNTWWLVFFKE